MTTQRTDNSRWQKTSCCCCRATPSLAGDGCQPPSGGAQVPGSLLLFSRDWLRVCLAEPLHCCLAMLQPLQRFCPGSARSASRTSREIRGHVTSIFSSSYRSTASLSRSECELASVVQSERSAHLSLLLSSCHCRAIDGESGTFTASLCAPTHMEDSSVPMSLAAFMKRVMFSACFQAEVDSVDLMALMTASFLAILTAKSALRAVAVGLGVLDHFPQLALPRTSAVRIPLLPTCLPTGQPWCCRA